VVRTEGLLGRRQGRRALALARQPAAMVMIEVIVVGRLAAGRLLQHRMVHFFFEPSDGYGWANTQAGRPEPIGVLCGWCGSASDGRSDGRRSVGWRAAAAV
jgi:hypothetical protein